MREVIAPRIFLQNQEFKQGRIRWDTWPPPERHSSAEKDQANTTGFMKQWGKAEDRVTHGISTATRIRYARSRLDLSGM